MSVGRSRCVFFMPLSRSLLASPRFVQQPCSVCMLVMTRFLVVMYSLANFWVASLVTCVLEALLCTLFCTFFRSGRFCIVVLEQVPMTFVAELALFFFSCCSSCCEAFEGRVPGIWTIDQSSIHGQPRMPINEHFAGKNRSNCLPSILRNEK